VLDGGLASEFRRSSASSSKRKTARVCRTTSKVSRSSAGPATP